MLIGADPGRGATVTEPVPERLQPVEGGLVDEQLAGAAAGGLGRLEVLPAPGALAYVAREGTHLPDSLRLSQLLISHDRGAAGNSHHRHRLLDAVQVGYMRLDRIEC